LIAGPLSAVTSPEHPWRSQKLSGDLPQDAMDAWYKLRNIIASRPVIAFPNFSLPFQIFVDACVGKPHADPPIRGGAGAILTQVQNGVTRAIGYFSRQFRDSESRYNAYNAELCGLVAALEHFMTHIKSSKVTAFTDHMPLVKAASKEKATADALLHKLSVMELTLIHITGPEMPADALSRQAKEAIKGNVAVAASTMMEAIPEAMSDMQWKFEQSEDSHCKVMKAWLKEQKVSPSSYMQSIIQLYGSRAFIDDNNGLLYIYSGRTKTWPNKRLWVPARLKSMIMANHHGSTLGGHWKEEKIYEAIAIKYFWPSMAQDIEGHVKLCKVCHQQDNRNNAKQKVPLHPWGPPTARNQRIHFDLVGPLKLSETDFKHILSITDAFSRWVELYLSETRRQ
jgi:ribonuclease HI